MNQIVRGHLLAGLAGAVAGGTVGGFTTRKKKDGKRDLDEVLDRIAHGAAMGGLGSLVAKSLYDRRPVWKGSMFRRGLFRKIGVSTPNKAREHVARFFLSDNRELLRKLRVAKEHRSEVNRARYDALVAALPESLREKAPEYNGNKVYSPHLPYGVNRNSDTILALLGTEAKWDTEIPLMAAKKKNFRGFTMDLTTDKGKLYPDSGFAVVSTGVPENDPFLSAHEQSHVATSMPSPNDTKLPLFSLPFWFGSGDNAARTRSGFSGYYIGPNEALGAMLRSKMLCLEVFGRIPKTTDEWRSMLRRMYDPEYMKSLPEDLRKKMTHYNMGIQNLLEYDKQILGGWRGKPEWEKYLEALLNQAKNNRVPDLYGSEYGGDTKFAETATPYERGFLAKCAEHGIDGRALLRSRRPTC